MRFTHHTLSSKISMPASTLQTWKGSQDRAQGEVKRTMVVVNAIDKFEERRCEVIKTRIAEVCGTSGWISLSELAEIIKAGQEKYGMPMDREDYRHMWPE